MPLVLFDLDNTLIDRAASFLRWAARFARACSLGPEDVAWLVATDEDGFADRHVFMAAVVDDIPAAAEILLAGR